MLRYTLCFVRRGGEILMLHRNKRPNEGLYNGVGGKIEPGEFPLASVLREVREETGIELTTARFGGTVTWGEDDGMYVYVADLSPYASAPHRNGRDTDEGRLTWLRETDVVNPNRLVVDNIYHFAPEMLAGVIAPSEFRCIYNGDGRLTGVTMHDLDDDVITLATKA